MRREPVLSIRWKMMVMFIASGFIAVTGVAIMTVAGYFVVDFPVIGPLLRYAAGQQWGMLIIFLTGIVLFFVSFIIMSSGTLKYFSKISNAVNRIASGDLDAHIDVQTNDELGRLAGDINRMAATLKKSIEEEREAERSKNELITSVSHDLRTPLTSILGYLALVDNDQYDDEVAMRHYVSIAHNKARALKRLIDDLFEFTRVNYRGLELRCETVNLGRMLEQLAEEFVPILQQSGMEYRLKLPEHKVNVHADPLLLVRVFENLMSNAVRYGSEGHYVDIELFEDNGWAAARIANYGAPIPETQLGRIFERFVRVEGSRSRDTGGAGLGLAIAKSIVELHAGNIRAYNENDRTVFEVRLAQEILEGRSGKA